MQPTPVMLYDEDCAFCRRWIRKWQAMTGERVRYLPYQKSLPEFPQVSEAECAKAVQLIFPEGKVFSGAHAVFQALAIAEKGRGFLWSYRHLPLFAPVSEGIYRLIARHRFFFSRFL